MSSRFSQYSSPRDARSALFSAYDAHASSTTTTQQRYPSPANSGNRNPYGYYPPTTNSTSANANGNVTFGAYPGAHLSPSSSLSSGTGLGTGTGNQQIQKPHRPYNDAVLSELESQNEDHIEGMSAKVKMLKDITVAIGDEIRDSTALAEKMNDSFEGTRVRLRSTMNRMLRMASRTGIGWRVWLAFIAVVFLLFWYVWMF